MRFSKKIYSSLLFIFCCLTPLFADDKAVELLEKTKDKFNTPYPTVASFTFVDEDQGSNTELHTHGSFISLGNKFILDLPDSKSWYNGSTLWTYIEAHDEVNISIPSEEEALAMNPAKLIELYMKVFDCEYLKIETLTDGQRAHHIRMNNDKQNVPIESIDVWVDDKDFTLKRINISTKDGKKQGIILSDIKIDKSISSDIFNFDNKSFPNAEIIDLR